MDENARAVHQPRRRCGCWREFCSMMFRLPSLAPVDQRSAGCGAAALDR